MFSNNSNKTIFAVLIISFVTAFCLIMFPAQAFAAKPTLPFDLKAPTATSMAKTPGDSPTSMNLAWNMDGAMTDYFAKLAASGEGAYEQARAQQMLADLGGEIWIETQIDWAIDDKTNGWHYTNLWDNPYGNAFGHNSNGEYTVDAWSDLSVLTYPKSVNSAYIMRGGDASNGWEPDGATPGLKDVLPAGSYTLNNSGSNWDLSIDYSQHTVHARVRYAVTVRQGVDDYYYFSDWSPVASYGKDAVASPTLTQDNLPEPKISNLRTADYQFNDAPVVLFDVDVPDELTARMTDIVAKGGEVRLYPEVRVDSGKWTEVDPLDVHTGEGEAKLIYLVEEGKVIEAGTPMELRCRYLVMPADDRDDFYSEYSNVINFDSDDVYGTGNRNDSEGNGDGGAGDNGNATAEGTPVGGEDNSNSNGNQSSGTITSNSNTNSNANSNSSTTSKDSLSATSDKTPMNAGVLVITGLLGITGAFIYRSRKTIL